VSPVSLKPAPVTLTCEIVTSGPPVFFSTSLCDSEFPTCSLVKLILGGVALRPPGETAVPESGMVRVGLGAFDVTVALPVGEPADCGAKVIVNVVLWPAAKVRGNELLFTVNPAPVAEAWEMATLLPPVLVKVADCCWLPPTWMLPNETLVGCAISDPGANAAPDRGRFKVVFEASLENATFPLAVPADCGANTTFTVALWPEERVSGSVKPVMLKPDPVAVACEIVTLASPVFVRVAD